MNKLVTSKIQSHLDNPTITIDIKNSVTSTNDYLLAQYPTKPQTHVCIAEQQTHGRGRLKKTWHSPAHHNIYLSLSVDIDMLPNSLGGLSLAMALATCAAIEKDITLPTPLQVKWPNDIYYDNQKLAGLLLETSNTANPQTRLVIGAGINVNMTCVQHNAIDQNWTSLALITDSQHDRNTLCARLINSWLQYLALYQESGLAHFMTEWNHRDVLQGKKVQLQQGKKIFEGIVSGISNEGYLQIALVDNTDKTFSSGEVKLLPIGNAS